MKRAIYVSPARLEPRGLAGRLRRRIERTLNRTGQRLAGWGMPPRLLLNRWRRHRPAVEVASEVHEVYGDRRFVAALPVTATCRRELAADRGWWGFAYRDVPARAVGQTRILRIPDARVLAGATDDAAQAYFPAVLDATGTSVDLREISFRPFHAHLVDRAPHLLVDRAVWVAERVFDNYAHWFTAHLPKLVLLRDRGQLDGLVLPAPRPAWIDASLRRIGLEPDSYAVLPRHAVLAAGSLMLVETDRFRPEMLDAARAAVADPPTARPARRVFVSRRAARGRRLLNEEALMTLVEKYGFESVVMEELEADAQIALMADTEVLLAPHGAGLTNMLFCPAGTWILEIADPAYPNPNFYAMAAALGHRYGWIPAEGVGADHPLQQDLVADEVALRRALELLP